MRRLVPLALFMLLALLFTAALPPAQPGPIPPHTRAVERRFATPLAAQPPAIQTAVAARITPFPVYTAVRPPICWDQPGDCDWPPED